MIQSIYMTEMNATVFENEDRALVCAAEIIIDCGLEAVINPARLVQVIYPNQLHQVKRAYVVITPAGNGLTVLEEKAMDLQDKARAKYDELQQKLSDLQQQYPESFNSSA